MPKGRFPNLPKIGDISGFWTVISEPFFDGKYWYVICRCECGIERRIKGRKICSGNARMCSSGKHAPAITHGMKHAPEYRAWAAMKHRCSSPKNPAFGHYGGRGIAVCERWLHSFENFYTDVGPRPSSEYSLDRFPNPNGNYEPGNVRWATRIDQQNNTTQNVFLEHGGKRMTVAEWSRETGISIQAMYKRIEYGWSDSRIVTEPVAIKNQRGHSHPPTLVSMNPLAIVAATETLA